MVSQRTLFGLGLIVIGLSGLLGFSIWGMLGLDITPNGTPLTIAEALTIAEGYLASLQDSDLAIREVMEFEMNFYVVYYEKSTGVGAFEMLIDRYSGIIFPEYGPNMMWNRKYGHMGHGSWMMRAWGQPSANMPVTLEQAVGYAQRYLDNYISGAFMEKPDVFYGYYTIHVSKDGKIYGMLSVNGYTGQVWYHNWHGTFIQMREFEEE